LLLGSCSAAQLTASSDAITVACEDARPVLAVAGAIPAAGVIAIGLQVACFSAEGIARLAADPASAVWIGQQKQILVDLARRAGVKI
jgi:hypothetical protein